MGKTKTAKCRDCGGTVPVNKDGTLRVHHAGGTLCLGEHSMEEGIHLGRVAEADEIRKRLSCVKKDYWAASYKKQLAEIKLTAVTTEILEALKHDKLEHIMFIVDEELRLLGAWKNWVREEIDLRKDLTRAEKDMREMQAWPESLL